mgnify:CR=1 FL=1
MTLHVPDPVARAEVVRTPAIKQLRFMAFGGAVVGAVIGFLTGIVVSTGPVNTPFFLAYGLTRGAFLSTEAMASRAVYASKSAVFAHFGALGWTILWKGLIVGSSVMAGSWLAKRFVLKMEPEQFRHLMDALMLVAGATMLATALG